jgi:formyl-CoA transferase
MAGPASNGALAGCRVLETGRFVTGPYAAQLLADLGAQVIKIEEPEGGDPFRGWGRPDWQGYGPPFVAFNRNKRSLTLDLKRVQSREVIHRLAQRADVFIENYRPGVADKLGLGYETLAALNPRLVYCSISGLGQDGPYAQRPCYDIVGQGLSGLLSQLVDLKNPRPVGPALSDALTGVFAAYGILAALQARERTGKGQRVETSLLQATMAFLNEPYSAFFGSGRSPDAFERPKVSAVFAFVCSDALPLAVHLSSPPKFWRAFVTAAGHAELLEDERFDTHAGRIRHWSDIHATLAPAFAARTRGEWLDVLNRADVPCAPIYRLDEAVCDAQVRHMDMVRHVEHPERGPVQVLGFPVELSDTPLEIASAPPTLGEHTDQILAEAGFSDEEIAALRASGAL